MKLRSFNYYFILSTVLIIFIKCLQFPSLTLHAEVFAEAGINFFYQAMYHTLWQNIWTTDAGYLPWTQRIIALIIIKGFHVVSLYAILIQMISIISIAIFSSTINFKIFRALFPSDLLRFMISLSIALIPEYELNQFINFAYYGFIPILLLLFVPKENLRLLQYIALFFVFCILILSKPHFLTFLPVLIVFSAISYNKRQYKSLAIYCVAIVGLFLQIISVLLHPNIWHKTSHLTFPLIKIVEEIMYCCLAIYKHVFLGDYVFNTIPSFIIFLFFIGIIFYLFIRKQLLEENKTHLYFFIVCNVIAFLSISMTITTVRAVFPPIMPFFGIPNDRHFIFANIAVLLAGITVLQSIIKGKKFFHIIFFLLMLNSSAFGFIYDKSQQKRIVFSSFDPYPFPQMSYSQWSVYSRLTRQDTYCIPINPFPWIISHNCGYLTKIYEFQTTRKKVTGIFLSDISKQHDLWNIQSIILVNIPYHTTFKKLSIAAYDDKNKKIAEAIQITPDNTYNYEYFAYPGLINGVKKIAFLSNGKTVPVIPTVMLMGKK